MLTGEWAEQGGPRIAEQRAGENAVPVLCHAVLHGSYMYAFCCAGLHAWDLPVLKSSCSRGGL